MPPGDRATAVAVQATTACGVKMFTSDLVRPTCALPHEHEEHHGSRGKGNSNELAARLSREYGATKPR